MNYLIEWSVNNWVEIIGAILGLLYIIYSIKQSILTWLTGLLTSALYIYIFLRSKFYADMLLQVYYVGISIYGWILWARGTEKTNHHELPVSRISLKLALILSIVSVAICFLIFFVLKNYTDSPVPYGDAVTTGLSIVATWMLARKILEHWLIWILVDALSVGLFIYKDLWATTVLFLVYTFMAWIGFVEWKRKLQSA